jgi:hypothetical protein
MNPMIHPTNPPDDPHAPQPGPPNAADARSDAPGPDVSGHEESTPAGHGRTAGHPNRRTSTAKPTPREERAIAFLRQIESLPDGELMTRLRGMVVRERRSTTQLLAHLAVLDFRRSFLAHGYSSLFNYCTRGLHFSEQAAYLRIEAARVVRKFPAVLARVADGSVHLTALSLLKPHLTAENHRELLDAARHRTRREIEDLVAQWRVGPPRARFDVLAIPPRNGDRATGFPLPFQPGGPGWDANRSRPGDAPAPWWRRASERDPAGSDGNSGGGDARFECDPRHEFDRRHEFDGRHEIDGRHEFDPRHETDRPHEFDHRHGSDRQFEFGQQPESDAWQHPGAWAEDGNDGHDPRSGPASVERPHRSGWPGSHSETVYRLHISIPAETRRKLDRASELLRHQIPDGDPARIIDRALGVLLDRLEQRKFARVLARPETATGVRPADLPVPEGKPPLEPPDDTPLESRSGMDRPPIPAAVRRAVWRRDRGRCQFVGSEGEQCDRVGLLEYHHRVPWARGGQDTVNNLELRCRPHNEYENELTYLRAPRGKDGPDDDFGPGVEVASPDMGPTPREDAGSGHAARDEGSYPDAGTHPLPEGPGEEEVARGTVPTRPGPSHAHAQDPREDGSSRPPGEGSREGAPTETTGRNAPAGNGPSTDGAEPGSAGGEDRPQDADGGPTGAGETIT